MTAAILWLAIPAAATAVLIALLRGSAWTTRLADHPNERSLHVHPTLRVGGVAMILAALPVAMLQAPELDLAWVLALALGALSFADDIRSLPIGVRLAAHFSAAAIAAAWLLSGVHSGLIAAVLVGLALAWMTNLYTFMDGSDGLAGGMTLVGFGAYAIAAQQAQIPSLALACGAIASAAAGFLAFNFPPARVFMGDAGSVPLGFLAGSIGLYGVVEDAWPAWFPVLVFSLFIVDASVTIARRIARRERFWVAHRSHYYQRLVLSGWSARRLAIAAYAVMGASAASALAWRSAEVTMQCAILAAWSGFYLFAIAAIARRGGTKSATS
jgi:UDP-N-acetylmuramyl pentapeptide phosphotransferase/UDP-N-acetylglucosamine-1-phosphate transferase